MGARKTAAGWVCALVLSLSASYAQSQEAGAAAQRLMVRSGLSVQLRGFTAQVEREIKQNNLEDRLTTLLAEAAQEAFRADLLEKDITARLEKRLTVAEMNAAIAWLERDLGQRVTRAEELAATSLDERSLREYVGRLTAKPLSATRRKLISDLVAATDAAKLAFATQEAITLGVAIGMDSLEPPERRVGAAELRARLRQMMPPNKVRAILAEELPILFAYTYRDISNADLASYATFLKSASGKRYQDGMSGAFVEGLARASVLVGELVARRQHQAAL